MYIDFVKYCYENIPEKERDKYIERDKKGYKEILRKWIEGNINQMVERKWEIQDIFFLQEISDFLKPLRESENLYEFGFYTGCIALIGVAAEDFSKYLALEKLKLTNDTLTQQQRLGELNKRNIITDNSYNRLDEIRRIRNGCLHFNQKFKQKSNEDLKKDAIKSINNLKSVISEMYGINRSVSFEEFSEIMEISIGDNFAANPNVKNFDDFTFKNRNAISHLLKIELAQHPDTKINNSISIFEVDEIDFDVSQEGEVTLIDLTNGIPVCVDLTKDFKKIIIDIGLNEKDTIIAGIYSKINEIGLSAFWYFKFIKKIII